jgi:hypothetical protein
LLVDEGTNQGTASGAEARALGTLIAAGSATVLSPALDVEGPNLQEQNQTNGLKCHVSLRSPYKGLRLQHSISIKSTIWTSSFMLFSHFIRS